MSLYELVNKLLLKVFITFSKCKWLVPFEIPSSGTDIPGTESQETHALPCSCEVMHLKYCVQRQVKHGLSQCQMLRHFRRLATKGLIHLS